jgi:hypothetical protein
MNLENAPSRPLYPWLIRICEAVRGTVEFEIECFPSFSYGLEPHQTHLHQSQCDDVGNMLKDGKRSKESTSLSELNEFNDYAQYLKGMEWEKSSVCSAESTTNGSGEADSAGAPNEIALDGGNDVVNFVSTVMNLELRYLVINPPPHVAIEENMVLPKIKWKVESQNQYLGPGVRGKFVLLEGQQLWFVLRQSPTTQSPGSNGSKSSSTTNNNKIEQPNHLNLFDATLSSVPVGIGNVNFEDVPSKSSPTAIIPEDMDKSCPSPTTLDSKMFQKQSFSDEDSCSRPNECCDPILTAQLLHSIFRQTLRFWQSWIINCTYVHSTYFCYMDHILVFNYSNIHRVCRKEGGEKLFNEVHLH